MVTVLGRAIFTLLRVLVLRYSISCFSLYSYVWFLQ